MKELPLDQYDRVRPLVQQSGMRGHLALVYELLEHRVNGQIWVNDQTHPETALICPQNGFYFVFGKPDEECLAPEINRMWADQPAMHENYATLFGSNPNWTGPLQRLFDPLGAPMVSRLAFIQQTATPDLPPPPGFFLEPISESLGQSILDGSGTHSFGIDPWFIRIAGGPAAYAANELGLALVKNGQIASLCGFCGWGYGEVEMEVGTVPAFRGQGLATIVCAAFMRQCQQRGLQPAYSCQAGNHASIAVAHKLGFVEIEAIQGFPLFPLS